MQLYVIFSVTDKSKAQMKKEPEKAKEEPSSMFQRQRVDMLLGELMRKFPLPMMPNPNAPPAVTADQTTTHPQRPDLKETTANNPTTGTTSTNGNNQNGDFKPPEKRAK